MTNTDVLAAITLTHPPGYTIMDFCGGRMKTIISSTLGVFIGLCAAAPAALALGSTSGVFPVVAAQSAQSVTTPQSAKQSSGSPDATHADVYYYFTMGHVDEMQFELTGQPDLATQSIEAYKKALELVPGSPVIMERLAEIYAKSQHIRDAVEQAQAALKADPNNVEAHRLLARIYVRTLGDLGAGDVQKENLEKAIAQFQAILKIQPDDAYSELWLARLYRFENQHGEAEKVLRDLLQRDPGNGAALEQLSQLLMDEGRSQEAVKILADAANDSSSPEVYDLLGDAYSQSKQYAKAEDAYRKAVEEDPDDPGHLHGLAQALMAQDKYAEALEQFKRLAEVEPGTAENYLRMAQLYRRLGKFDQAESSLLRAKQLAPGSLEVLYNEALLYEDQGRYADAVRVLSDAIAGMKSQSNGSRNSNPPAPIIRRAPRPVRMRWRSFTSNWATPTASRKTITAAIRTYEDMAKLGPDAQKRAEMLLIDTYRESRDLDHAIAETKKAAGRGAERSEPDRHPGHAVRRKIRHRSSDQAPRWPIARQRQRPGNLSESGASAGARQKVHGGRTVRAKSRADVARR